MPPERDSKYLTLAATLFAVAMTFIDQTIVSIAAPTIQDELGLSREGTRWIVNAYLLALAATFALGGRIADVVGPRRMMIVGVIGFATASALCGLTPTGSVAEPWIIFFRIVQGVSAALMVPAALAIVVSVFPVHERGRALAIFFAISGGLTAIGPIAGGYLTQWTWRAIFWINIPVAVAALVVAWVAHIPDNRRPARIDWTGAAIITVGMALSVLGFEQAQEWGWGSWRTILCIVAGFAFIVLFALFEVRQRSPLIQMKVFKSRAFVVDNVVLFFSMMAFIPVFFFASVYAQVSLGYDANKAGLYLLLIFAGFAPSAQVGGRMLDRGGARKPIILGSIIGTVGFALWANSATNLSLGAQWPYIVLSGIGLGLIVGPASTDAVNRAIGASYGEVTGITQTVRNYGSALGVAILGTLLSNVFLNRLTSSLEGFGIPAATAKSAANTAVNGSGGGVGDAPAAIRDQVNTAVMQDYATATKYVLWGMAAALFLTLLAALRHPGGQAAVATDEHQPAPQPSTQLAPEHGS